MKKYEKEKITQNQAVVNFGVIFPTVDIFFFLRNDENTMDDHAAVHVIIISLLVLVIINLFVLDLRLFSPAGRVRVAQMQTAIPTVPPVPTEPAPMIEQDTCGEVCKRLIEESVRNALATLTVPSPRPVVVAQAPAAIREFYIPLGSGSTMKSTWENLTATETRVDTSSYGTISETTFIAALRNPTKNGQVEVQLYNVTDNHPVWGSHMIMSNAVSQTMTSGPIQLDSGNKLYRVQIKSTLSYDAYLDSAKLRIVSR